VSGREIIRVEGLSKAYAIYERPIDMLKEAVTGRKHHDTFWALRDVNFSMREKERVGIIGANGSGKSTLLKIITGHLPPTAGSVQVQGRVSAMLSLNTVLNPEETGLANIRFNLLLNGCPKEQVESKAEEIIEFTELGPFIYAPVKTYSSGMNAKLAFAITTSIDPDILVIDEVLSVGDAYFMGKATRRMKDLCERGNGLLFVSHSTSAVQMLCDKVLWMENGAVRMYGDCDFVLRAYEEDYRHQEDEVTRSGNASRARDQRHAAAVQDIDSPSELRLRLVGDNAKGTLADTHYVSGIRVSAAGGAAQEVPLILPASAAQEGCRLDVMASEWGRLYEHRARECRALASKTGKRKGGHILLDAPVAPQEVLLEVESCSRGGYEMLALETVDVASGTWQKAQLVGRDAGPGGWTRSRFRFEARPVDPLSLEQALAKVAAMNQPAVSITEVAILSANREASVVREHEAFTVRVQLNARAPLSEVDVGIKFTRSDGVYAFWQSSGLAGQNIDHPSGDVEVHFVFERNVFGAGDYALTAYVANGWDFPANYPYSEVYDRKVGCLQFKVLPAVPGLDMGIINQRVKVRIRKGNDAEAIDVQAVARVAE
jgi:lipopolysaccharide transport system ATP-binding protein